MSVADRSPPVSIPRLVTARLLLREYREPDFEAFAASSADPEASRFTGVLDRRQAYRVFAAQMGSWILRGAGWWAIELRATGELVGRVGAFYREGSPDLELGWFTQRAAWGRGIASEAAAEAARYGFVELDAPRVIALVDAGNAASIAVARRLGMRYERETTLLDKVLGQYAVARPERA